MAFNCSGREHHSWLPLNFKDPDNCEASPSVVLVLYGYYTCDEKSAQRDANTAHWM